MNLPYRSLRRALRLTAGVCLAAILAACTDANDTSSTAPAAHPVAAKSAAVSPSEAVKEPQSEAAQAAAPASATEVEALSHGTSNVVRFFTTLGEIDIELDPERAPLTSANFMQLVEDGFYEGLIFHRVLANFVIQAGGHEVDLTFREAPRNVKNESSNGLKNLKGTISMARLNDPDSAGAQFFINVKDNANLDPQPNRAGYTVFGKVVAGMDVVTAIELSDVKWAPVSEGLPETPIVIERAQRL